jgi:hypothetical protein
VQAGGTAATTTAAAVSSTRINGSWLAGCFVQAAEAPEFAEVALSSTARLVSICQGIGGGGQLKALQGKQGKAGHEIKDLRNRFERYLFQSVEQAGDTLS